MNPDDPAVHRIRIICSGEGRRGHRRPLTVDVYVREADGTWISTMFMPMFRAGASTRAFIGADGNAISNTLELTCRCSENVRVGHRRLSRELEKLWAHSGAPEITLADLRYILHK